MREEIDWSFSEEHMWSRHRVLVQWAKEAVVVVRFDGRLFAASAWKANDVQARGYREGDCDHE